MRRPRTYRRVLAAPTLLDAVYRLHLQTPVSHADLVRVIAQIHGARLVTNISGTRIWRRCLAEGRALGVMASRLAEPLGSELNA